MTSSLAACVCVFWPLPLRVTSLVCCGCTDLHSVVCLYQPVNECSSRINRSTAGSIISINSLQFPSHSQSTPCWLCVCAHACVYESVWKPTECVRSTAMILDRAMFHSSSVKALVTSPCVAWRIWSSTTKNLTTHRKHTHLNTFIYVKLKQTEPTQSAECNVKDKNLYSDNEVKMGGTAYPTIWLKYLL